MAKITKIKVRVASPETPSNQVTEHEASIHNNSTSENHSTSSDSVAPKFNSKNPGSASVECLLPKPHESGDNHIGCMTRNNFEPAETNVYKDSEDDDNSDLIGLAALFAMPAGGNSPILPDLQHSIVVDLAFLAGLHIVYSESARPIFIPLHLVLSTTRPELGLFSRAIVLLYSMHRYLRPSDPWTVVFLLYQVLGIVACLDWSALLVKGREFWHGKFGKMESILDADVDVDVDIGMVVEGTVADHGMWDSQHELDNQGLHMPGMWID